jgi:hypothetical protein
MQKSVTEDRYAQLLARWRLLPVQRLVREGEFPRPRQLSERRVGWLVREIEEWAETRPLSDQLPPENTSRNSKAAML